MAFHESRVVIIETGRRVVRAGLGLGELLHVPSVEILARVGLRKPSANGASTSNSIKAPSTEARVSDYLVGTGLDEALANGEAVDVYWPFAEAKIASWNQAEAIWKYILFTRLKIRRQLNECPVLLSLPAKLSRMTHMLLCRLFFERFNVAGFTYIERPLASLYAANLISGVVVEINQDEMDLITAYESGLHHSGSLSVPVGIRDCERYLAHILKSNSSVISSLAPPEQGLDQTTVDMRLVGLARFLWQNGHIKIPIEGEGEKEEEGNLDIAALLVTGKEKALIDAASNKKKAQQTKADKEREKEMAAMDLITIQYQDYPSMMVGRERHRFCEPLFEPGVLYHASIPQQTVIAMDGFGQPPPPVSKDPDFILPIHTAVHSVIKAAAFSQRSHIYFGILITGPLANIQGLGAALQSRLSLYLVADRINAENPVPGFQPNFAQTAKVPEYFAEFRDKGDQLSAFLGCGIVAKMTFGDSSGRNFVSKAEYGDKGPPAILELTPTIL